MISSMPVWAAAPTEFKDSSDIVQTLKKYPAEALSDSHQTADALVDLHRSVEFSKDHELSDEAFDQILKTSAAAIQNDPQSTAAEILAPLYKKDPSLFEKHLKLLPKKSRDNLLKQVKLSIKEADEGNG
jgi:hypothetical protein